MSFLEAIMRRLQDRARQQQAWVRGIELARDACLCEDTTRKTVAVLAPQDVHDALERVAAKYNFNNKKQAAELAVRVGLVLLLQLDGGQDDEA
jgi:hypothetical protein